MTGRIPANTTTRQDAVVQAKFEFFDPVKVEEDFQGAYGDAEAPTRQHRTHTSPAVVQAFKSLSLKSKLMMCKDIEERNDERNLKTLRHAIDPVSQPQPGSEAASMFTLENEDIERLKRPSFASLFKEVMPTFLAKFLIDQDRSAAKDHKREADDDQRVAKRRCMNGASLRPRSLDAPLDSSLDIQFTQLLYETEDCGMVPLPLFLNSSLLYLSVDGSNIPTMEANFKPGEKKGLTIIDCTKLLARLNLAELQMSHAEWMEAASNCYRFHCSRDVVESGGTYSSWWEKHYNFFNLQRDKVLYYNAWKGMELELRQEFYAQPTTYDPAFYALRYEIVKDTFDIKLQMRTMLPAPTHSSGTNPARGTTRTPFPSGSGNRHTTT